MYELERPDSVFDNVKRTTLFDIVMETQRSLKKKAIIQRIIIIGKTLPLDRAQQNLG